MEVRKRAAAVLLHRASMLAGGKRSIWLAKRISGKADLIGLWEVPAGKCEDGETAAAAAAREVREETGIAIGEARLTPRGTLILPHHGDDQETEVTMFEAEIRSSDEPLNTELGKRTPWLEMYLDSMLPSYDSMTPATAALVRALRFRSGLRG